MEGVEGGEGGTIAARIECNFGSSLVMGNSFILQKEAEGSMCMC